MRRLGNRSGKPRVTHSKMSILHRLTYYSGRLRVLRQDILRGDMHAFKEMDAVWASIDDWLDFFLEDHGGRFGDR